MSSRKKVPAPLKFTTTEESMILTAVANGISLCCSATTNKQAAIDINAIIETDIARKQVELEAFAYDALGCSFSIESHPDIWDRYLQKTIEWLRED